MFLLKLNISVFKITEMKLSYILLQISADDDGVEDPVANEKGEHFKRINKNNFTDI